MNAKKSMNHPFKVSFLTDYFRSVSVLTFGLVCTIFPTAVLSQHSLPKHEVIKEKKVQAIHVDKKGLDYEYPEGYHQRNTVTLDPRPQRIASYYFNPTGQLDSVYHYPREDVYHEKDIYYYDEFNRLIETKTISSEGKETSRAAVKWLANGEWLYQEWQYGELKTAIRATGDSIAYQTIRYSGDVYMSYTYDLNDKSYSMERFDGSDTIPIEGYEWVVEEGVPTGFLYSEYEWNDKKKTAKAKTDSFEVDENGNVINRLNGTIFDPFHMHNYFDNEQFHGIRAPHEYYFKEDALDVKREVSELFLFDGTRIRYQYDYTYVFF